MQNKLIIPAFGFDPGFGDIKESYRDPDTNEIVNNKYSSIVAYAPPEANDMPEFEGRRYYMGEDALLRDSEDIVEITDYLRLEQYSPMFLGKSLIDNDISIKDLKYIVTGLSFSQMQKGADFIKRLSKFKFDGKVFDLKDKILLAPQGVGAKYAIEYYFKNVPKSYMIIDIGFFTIDTVDVINGKVRPENVHGFRDKGIIKIARALQDYIGKEMEEHISLKEAKEIIAEKKMFLEGEEIDLSKVIADFSRDYTIATMNELKNRFSREFKRYQRIYFVGGGAYYIYKDFSKIIEVVPQPEFYNSIGNLLKAEQELAKKS